MNLGEKLREALKEHISNKYYNGIPIKDTRQFSVVNGPAFFPVGNGVYNVAGHPDESKIRIMILGQDFGTVGDYDWVNECGGSEIKAGVNTWNNLLNHISVKTGINPAHCFYTNAIMGLRIAPNNVGRSKAFLKNDIARQFLEKNRSFFIEYQLKEFVKLNKKPKLVIALGAHLPRFLSACFNELRDISEVQSLKQLSDSQKYRLPVHIESKNIDIVFVTHPCMFQANTGRRGFSEIDLIKTGLEAIGYAN